MTGFPMSSNVPGQIDLRLVFTDEVADDDTMQRCRALLSEDERRRGERFHFEKDRRRHVITRALVRTTLSRYARVSPSDWSFRVNAHGKPEVANEGSDAAGISFNVSHTEELIALAVTSGVALGVDAEAVHRRPAPVGVARRWFTAPEATALAQLPPQSQDEGFFQYWTLKESYVKARGMGLSIPLDKFGFELTRSDGIEVSIDAVLEDAPQRWRFWQLRLASSFVVAVCVQRSEHAEQRLVVSKVVPLGSEQAIECCHVRKSI
jgi:4'-phosphopantetheinyl transferase